MSGEADRNMADITVVHGPVSPCASDRLMYQVSLPGGFTLTSAPVAEEPEPPGLTATETGLVFDQSL